jgi:hypothetical protein
VRGRERVGGRGKGRQSFRWKQRLLEVIGHVANGNSRADLDSPVYYEYAHGQGLHGRIVSLSVKRVWLMSLK